MYDKLVKLKVFQPEIESKNHKSRLDAMFSYPDRYRLVNAWIDVRDGIPYCCVVGMDKWFAFPDNFCPKFWGAYPAIILGEISEERMREADRFIEYEEQK